MKLIEHEKCVYLFRLLGNEDVIRDILWTHPNSMNSFPTVLICNTTYKTKKYLLLLLEIVSITSTNITFIVAFAYLSFEKTNNFEWILNKVKGLFVKDDVLPQVIVSDRDFVFMNALKTMFSS